MITVVTLLLVAAFICLILEALGKCPGWIPTLLVVVALLVERLPK